MNISRIRKFLKKYKNFLITAHTNSEGDCLGAELAFAKVIKAMGKDCQIVNSDNCPKEYAFLPEINNIISRSKLKNFDAAIILDCSDISRIGNVVNYLNKNIPILNIDHHISNTYFGDINLVDIKVSSTCEIIYQLFKRLKFKLNRDMAICLYAGIVADTGSFRYTNTSALTHLIASQLLKWNIDAAEVYRNIYGNLTFLELELINKALLNIKRDRTGKIAWVSLTHNMVRRYDPQTDIAENILNFIRSLRTVEVSVLFKERREKEQHIRVNLRSTGKIDVNKIAQHFGGGGHKTASGITFRDKSLKIVETKVIGFIKKEINK